MTTAPVSPSLVPAEAAVAMTPSEALDIVHELACLGQLDEFDAARDASLAAQGRWQRAALDRLGQILFEHGKAIDARLALPPLAQCTPVPDWLWQPERDMDPEVPSNAVRICLELAQDTALEATECGHEPALLAGRARQQHALVLVRAFLGLHAEAFDAALREDADPEPIARALEVAMEATASQIEPASASGGRTRSPSLN